MKVTVDEPRCMGHGQCEIAAPDLFEIDDEGIARVRIAEPDESRREEAETAARRCPEAAITIVD